MRVSSNTNGRRNCVNKERTFTKAFCARHNQQVRSVTQTTLCLLIFLTTVELILSHNKEFNLFSILQFVTLILSHLGTVLLIQFTDIEIDALLSAQNIIISTFAVENFYQGIGDNEIRLASQKIYLF